MDYAAVAGSVVLGTPGVRACLVVSADGLALAAYPAAEEADAAEVWARLSSLGQVTRGFVTMRSEVWAFVQGERFGALVLADRTVRPGQVLDLVDQVLAEAAAAAVISGGADRRIDAGAQRDQRDWAAGAGPGPVPGRKLRSPLHRGDRPSEPEPDPEAALEPVAAAIVVELDATAGMDAEGSASVPDALLGDRDDGDDGGWLGGDHVDAPDQAFVTASAGVDVDVDASADAGAASEQADAANVEHDRPADRRSGGAVDIIALAREFAGLLAERDDGTP